LRLAGVVGAVGVAVVACVAGVCGGRRCSCGVQRRDLGEHCLGVLPLAVGDVHGHQRSVARVLQVRLPAGLGSLRAVQQQRAERLPERETRERELGWLRRRRRWAWRLQSLRHAAAAGVTAADAVLAQRAELVRSRSPQWLCCSDGHRRVIGEPALSKPNAHLIKRERTLDSLLRIAVEVQGSVFFPHTFFAPPLHPDQPKAV
jgi:hypothetical protein